MRKIMRKIKFLKIGWLILGDIAVYIYYQQSEIGRYQLKEESSSTILDTKTGSIYFSGKLKYEVEK